MRFGICASVDYAQWAHDAGFDYIELPLSKIGQLDDSAFCAAKSTMLSCGIKAERFNLLFPKELRVTGKHADKKQIEQWLRKSFSRMKELGGTLAVFGSGKSRMIDQGDTFEACFSQLIDIVRMTGDVASDYGISIAIEPLNRRESNMINSVTEAAMLSHCVSKKNVGVLADWYHITAENEPVEHINTVQSLFHAHIAQGKERKYPSGDGAEIKPFFDALKAIGYEGTLSIEAKTDDIKIDGPAALALLKRLS